QNTYVGIGAGSGTTGQNTATGFDAFHNNTTGEWDVANGVNALLNTTGTGNTGIGGDALQTNTTGSHNTALGYLADVGVNNLTNATAIGWSAKVNISNALVLGNGANVGIGTSSPSQLLEVAGNALISSTGGASNQLQFQNPAGTFTSTFQAGAQTANISYTLPIAVPAGVTYLSNNGAGVLSWAAGIPSTVVTNATLIGNGSGASPLGINLANSNTWTAAQTISTSGAGTVTDLTLANSVASAVNSGAELDIQAKNAASTLKTVAAVSGTITTTTTGAENGSLFLSTVNTGTLKNEVTVDHAGSVTLAAYGKGVIHSSAAGLLTSSSVATGDIAVGGANQFLVTNGTPAVAWAGLNINGTLVGNGIGTALGLNLASANTWSAAETFAGPLQVAQHILEVGPLLGPVPIIAANIAGGNVTDAAGLVTFTATTGTPGCGYLLYIPVAVPYAPPPTSVSVVVSGDSCNSEALFPYGKYVPVNWIFAGSPPSIVIGVVNPPAIGTPYKFDYHVIEIH
ncbi:MAG TPA: hypothetical protein VFA55_07970, partial [Candidatus Kapabacteria bacterium]|nr:hypothetical protein [Candidatus Kapabacteria bacterium]